MSAGSKPLLHASEAACFLRSWHFGKDPGQHSSINRTIRKAIAGLWRFAPVEGWRNKAEPEEEACVLARYSLRQSTGHNSGSTSWNLLIAMFGGDRFLVWFLNRKFGRTHRMTSRSSGLNNIASLCMAAISDALFFVAISTRNKSFVKRLSKEQVLFLNCSSFNLRRTGFIFQFGHYGPWTYHRSSVLIVAPPQPSRLGSVHSRRDRFHLQREPTVEILLVETAISEPPEGDCWINWIRYRPLN